MALCWGLVQVWTWIFAVEYLEPIAVLKCESLTRLLMSSVVPHEICLALCKFYLHPKVCRITFGLFVGVLGYNCSYFRGPGSRWASVSLLKFMKGTFDNAHTQAF